MEALHRLTGPERGNEVRLAGNRRPGVLAQERKSSFQARQPRNAETVHRKKVSAGMALETKGTHKHKIVGHPSSRRRDR